YSGENGLKPGQNRVFRGSEPEQPGRVVDQDGVPHRRVGGEGSGFYAIKKIQEIDPKAKIVAVTANSSYSVEEKLEKLHIPLIQKPFKMDQVISIITN
ncbi:MAG: hypothetical protein V3R39_04200, partial [Nitrosopumilus sp.]